VNPKFTDELRSVRIKGDVQLPNGTVLKDPDVYTLIFARLAQMGAIWTGN